MITFRDLESGDKGLLVQYLNNANVTKHLSSRIPQPYSDTDAEWWVTSGSKVGVVKAIIFKNILVGVIGVTPGEHEHSRSAELGYWLCESYWGNGIATVAVESMTKDIFSNTEIIRLFAHIFSPNIDSMNVVRKCGYKLEGINEKAIYKHGQYLDSHLYAKINT